MWSWLGENSQIIDLFIGFGTLSVWFGYLHLFLYDYKRRRRCRILITLAGSLTQDARCCVCNMSEEAIYVISLMVVMTTAGGTWRRSVTDCKDDDRAAPPDSHWSFSRQGPLG